MPDSADQPRGQHARHSYRSRHRAASHASAHADSQHDKPHTTIEHPLVPRGSAQVVSTDLELQQLINHLRQARSFAYDSEFIGELTYYPKLCLIQIATTERIALIDPLAGLRLEPFWELLADESTEKIVHAGEQDIEPVARLIGKPCRNVFDTQVCAGFIGLSFPVSLSKLVNEITGAKLGKGLTFSHWDQRPLSSMQLRYAADDVRYLPAVRDAIGKKLDEMGHTAWAREECESLCEPARYAFDPDSDYLRVRSAGTLSAAGLAVLRELMIWRDQAAREADVPPRAFLRDEILVDLSRSPPKSVDKLARVKGLPRPVEHEHGQAVVELTQRALSQPLQSVPERAPEPTPSERFRADSLWSLVQSLCLANSIDPNVVVSRQDVTELDRALHNGADIADHRLMTGWRADAVGRKLMEVVRGGETLRLSWAQGKLSF